MNPGARAFPFISTISASTSLIWPTSAIFPFSIKTFPVNGFDPVPSYIVAFFNKYFLFIILPPFNL